MAVKNETDRANWDVYDDFKLKKTLCSLGLYKNISMPHKDATHAYKLLFAKFGDCNDVTFYSQRVQLQ